MRARQDIRVGRSIGDDGSGGEKSDVMCVRAKYGGKHLKPREGKETESLL